MPLKRADFFIFIPALGAVILSFLLIYAHNGNRSLVNIKTGSGEWVYPAGSDEIISVPGPLGNTVVQIHDNSACIVSSPCPNQTCVASGVIKKHGQWSACLPNQVMLFISEGKNEENIDAAVW